MRVIFFVACCVAAWVCFPANAGQPEREKLPDFPIPLLLNSGLTLKEKALFVGEKKLPLEAVPAELAGAAFYEKDGLLITVTRDGKAVLYETKDGKLEAKAKQDSGNVAISHVHFTRVPGLLFLYGKDIDRAKRFEDRRTQVTFEFASRVALSDEAKKYNAMPADQADADLLAGCYLLTEQKSVPFSIRPGEWRTLELGAKLAAPFRGGPGDHFACGIFVFDKGNIVSLTETGWSLNELEGKLVKHFNAPKLDFFWWNKPTLVEKDFFVYAQTGPGGHSYLLDVKSGQLVEAGQ